MDMVKLRQLEEAYNRALALEKAGERERSAEVWREVLALDPEDHGGAAVRLASLGMAGPPPRAPRAYVETLFDQTAEVFDEVLVDHLGYSVPEQMRQCLEAGEAHAFARMLDLGCGTGLVGVALREMAREIIGVDLSENMLAHAFEREVYDDLYVGEAVQFLEEEDGEPFDLITAADVMPYLGDLAPLFAAAAPVLHAGGLLIFSTETLADHQFGDRDWTVGPHQRFAHRLDYVVRELTGAGFEPVEARQIVIRHEEGEPITGHLVLARKALPFPPERL